MTLCSVCHKENDHLAVVCVHCGGFLQQKIDTLDLFETGWNVLEKPFKTFHLIAIARHKNYLIFLSSILGFGYVFSLFFFLKAGEYTQSFISILLAGIVLGPFVGVLCTTLFALVMKWLVRISGSSISYWNSLATTVYSQIPVIFTVILFLPIELMTFGLFFFTRNPSPYMLRPTSYVLLTGLDTLFALWSLVLMTIGLKVILSGTWNRVILIVVVSVIVMLAVIFTVVRLVVPQG